LSQIVKRLLWCSLAILICGYIGLLVARSLNERPREDEALLSNPAYNLAFHGYMGSSIIEEQGSDWAGINRVTYNTLPVGILDAAAWFRLFGASLLVARLASTFWVLVMLAGVFFVLRTITGRDSPAAVAVFIAAIDYNVMASGTMARADALTAALGWLGMAVYLWLRPRNLVVAVLAACACIVASGLAHPNGAAFFAAFLVVAFWYDRRRFTWQHAVALFVPFAVGGALWAAYLLKAPDDARAQLKSNATMTNPLSHVQAGRLAGFLHPIESVRDEIVLRYFPGYGLPVGEGIPFKPKTLKALVLLLYALGMIAFLLDPALRNRPENRLIFALTSVFLLYFCFFEAMRYTYYLIDIIPFFSAILAMVLLSYWNRGPAPRALVATLIFAMAMLQVSGVISLIRASSYRNEYLPATTFLKNVASPEDLVFASADFGFNYGFDRNSRDEITIGYRSHRVPRFIVMESTYVNNYNDWEKSEPQYFRFMRNRLAEYKLIYDKGNYKIYQQP
jgi:hypothetical protein